MVNICGLGAEFGANPPTLTSEYVVEWELYHRNYQFIHYQDSSWLCQKEKTTRDGQTS